MRLRPLYYAITLGLLLSGCRSQRQDYEVGGVIQLRDSTLTVGSFQTCGRDSAFDRSSRPGKVLRRSAYFSDASLTLNLRGPFSESGTSLASWTRLERGKEVVVVSPPGKRRGWPFTGDDGVRLIRVMEKYGCLYD